MERTSTLQSHLPAHWSPTVALVSPAGDPVAVRQVLQYDTAARYKTDPYMIAVLYLFVLYYCGGYSPVTVIVFRGCRTSFMDEMSTLPSICFAADGKRGKSMLRRAMLYHDVDKEALSRRRVCLASKEGGGCWFQSLRTRRQYNNTARISCERVF